MKLGFAKTKVDSQGEFETQQFDFGDKRVIMEILRGKMYSDPIYTICQEITSNARDAHREVKQGGKPIVVKFPAELDDSFYIQDFGPGISPSRMSDVFIKYGASTKRDSNKETGGFGLGAKTPFAYSDMFNIVTVTEEDAKNIRREYIAYIDESRIGAISLTKTEETKDPTGTKIILRAKKEDADDFQSGIFRACYFWKTRPKLLPENDYGWSKPEYVFESKTGKWAIEKSSSFSDDEALAIVDGVQYPLQNLGIKDGNKYTKILESRIRIFFKVGEVKVTANREAIDVDDKARKKITQIFDSVDEELNEHARSRIIAHSNVFDAVSEYKELARIYPINKLKWNGCDLVDSVRYDGEMMHYYLRDNSINMYQTNTIKVSKDTRIFTTTNSGWPRGKRIVEFLKEFKTKEEDIDMYVLKERANKQLPEILKHVKVRDIKDIKATKPQNAKIKKLRLVEPASNKTYWPESDEDLEHGEGVYCILKGTKCLINKGWRNREWIERFMGALWGYDKEFKLHAVLKQHASKLGPGWSSVDSYTIKTIKELNRKLGQAKNQSDYSMMEYLPEWLYHIIRLNRKKFKRNGICYTYYERSLLDIRNVKTQVVDEVLKDVRDDIIERFGGKIRSNQTNTLLKPLSKIFYRKYPLIKYLKNNSDHMLDEPTKELEEIVVNHIIEKDNERIR